MQVLGMCVVAGQVSIPCGPPGERSATLAAHVSHMQMYFLDVPNYAFPFHGSSSATAPFANHNSISWSSYAMSAQVFGKVCCSDALIAGDPPTEVPQTYCVVGVISGSCL